MTKLYPIIPFVILAVIFAVVGLRDMVGFLRIGPGSSKRYAVWLMVMAWLGGIVLIVYRWGPVSVGSLSDPFWTKVLVFSLALFVVISFGSSLKRHGPGRVRAIAWTTFLEAMSQRAWMAVPLWLLGVLSVGIFISPYRLVQDRMMLTTELLIHGQLLVIGVLTLGLACRSIPRELARKTIMITASKPISLLELVGGKLLGFILLGGVLLTATSILSYAVLWYQGQQVRQQARLELAVQQEQYQQGQRQLVPDSDLQDIVEHGVLYSRNSQYPTEPVRFNGKFDPELDNRGSCLKGRSGMSVRWHFDGIPVTNRVPMLGMGFTVERVPQEISKVDDYDPIAPLEIRVKGTSVRFPRNSKVTEEWELPVPPQLAGVGINRAVRFSVGKTFVLDPTKWDRLYNRGPVLIEVTFRSSSHYLYFHRGSVALGNLSPAQIAPADQPTWVWPAKEGRALPHRFRNAYEIPGAEAGEPEVAYWQFKNVDLRRFGAGEQIRFEIKSYREKSDVVKSHTVGLIRAMSIKPDGQKTFWPSRDESKKDSEDPETSAEQKKLLEKDWPGWKPIVIQERRPSGVDLPRSLFSKDANVYIFLACGSAKDWLAVGDKSGYLSRGRSSFAGNLLRCELIVFLQLSAIAAVAVMASSFLSWPVACFLSMVIYLLGAARPYMQEMAKFWGQAAEQLNSYTAGMFGGILPNFGLYKATEFISKGEVISGEKLAALFNQTSVCIVGLVVVAYLFLRCRELAK